VFRGDVRLRYWIKKKGGLQIAGIVTGMDIMNRGTCTVFRRGR